MTQRLAPVSSMARTLFEDPDAIKIGTCSTSLGCSRFTAPVAHSVGGQGDLWKGLFRVVGNLARGVSQL